MSTDNVRKEIEPCNCGVPKDLHGTLCGWTNGLLINYPVTEAERGWQREWLKENNAELVINGDGHFLRTETKQENLIP